MSCRFVDTLLFDIAEKNPEIDLIVRLDDTGTALFTGVYCAMHCNTLQHTATHCNTLADHIILAR